MIKVNGRILVIDDDELIGRMLSRSLKSSGFEVRVETGAEGIVDKIKAWFPDIVLLDISLPGRSGIDILREIVEQRLPAQVVMLTADDTAETAVKAMKLGAVDYLTKPFNIEEVKILFHNILERVNLTREVDYLRKVHAVSFDREMIGVSAAMKDLRSTVEKMAAARVSSLLITGESGTGKELMARYFHNMLQDSAEARRRPYIAVNCAALPEHLLESELFGYEKGSFTDAKTDKKGVFELANGGVILLDEVGEMQPALQSKLLRFLEERKVRHIGGAENIPVNVAVIATTNKDLSEEVKNGAFRSDLFYRLNSFHVTMPSLRERKEDIPLLARHFTSLFSRRYNKKGITSISPAAEKIMTAYPWPGNIRELKNCVERLVVLGNAGDILAENLPRAMTGAQPAVDRSTDGRFVLPEAGISLEDLERDLIRQALERTKHNKAQAAKLLNITYDTLRYQVKKYGLEE
ncbi:MAG: sigma-54 dependent transcriptional regulator [Nitrospirota bacterium]